MLQRRELLSRDFRDSENLSGQRPRKVPFPAGGRSWGDFSNPFIAGVCRCRSALSCAIFSGSCRSKTSSSADSSALSSGRQLSLNTLCGCESFICRRRLARLQGRVKAPLRVARWGCHASFPLLDTKHSMQPILKNSLVTERFIPPHLTSFPRDEDRDFFRSSQGRRNANNAPSSGSARKG